MRCVGGVSAVVVTTLSDPNPFLTVLPVILMRASTDVVRSILELLVPQPHGGPVGAASYDPSRWLDDVVGARPAFAQA